MQNYKIATPVQVMLKSSDPPVAEPNSSESSTVVGSWINLICKLPLLIAPATQVVLTPN